MNNRANFTLIGIFVSVVSLLFFVGVYWIIKPSSDHKVLLYGLLVTESITGINLGTNVKYQGLEVGKVKNFRINPNNPREIMMDLEIRRDVPIRDGVMASIKPQGITGLSFIDIQVEEGAKPLREIHYLGQTYKVIPYKPSFLSSLTDSADDITTSLRDILNKVNLMLDANGEESQTIIHELAHTSKQLNKLLSDENIENTKRLIVNTDRLVSNADRMIGEYLLVGKEAKGTLQSVNLSIKEGDYNLKQIAADMPQETILMLREIRLLAAEFSRVLHKLEENPNAILFESTTPTPGPGE